jgi:hypothetical protein
VRLAEPHADTETRQPARARDSRPETPAFLVHGQLGRRQGLETVVRDRLPALDRKAVRAGSQTLLGALERGQLRTQIVAHPFVQLVLKEIRSQIRRVEERVRQLTVVLVYVVSKPALESPALGGEQLTGSFDVHHVTSL